VAIRAQQDALAYLCAQTFDAVGTTAGDSELLCAWIEMVELQCAETAIVATEPATSSELRDE
jgi:hypothetical protein